MDNTTDGTWDSLPVRLNSSILQTLRELKFTHMTPVQVMFIVYTRLLTLFNNHIIWWRISSLQSACIPLFMSNKDVAAEAVSVIKYSTL